MKFEGTQVNIPIKGIMRAGTDNVCADGAMNEVIGMEYKDGSWIPYLTTSEQVTLVTPTQGGSYIGIDVAKVYVHKLSDGTQHIVALTPANISGERTLYYEYERASVLSSLHIRCNKLAEHVKDIEFVGNMLCVSTTSGAEYYLWNEGEYKTQQVSNKPKVSLRVTKGLANKGGEHIVGYEYVDIKTGQWIAWNAADTLVVDNFNNDTIISSMIAARGGVRDEGGLTGYVLACVAFRMKNGDLVVASAPVLLCSPLIARRDAYSETMKNLSNGADLFTLSSDAQGEVRKKLEISNFDDVPDGYTEEFSIFTEPKVCDWFYGDRDSHVKTKEGLHSLIYKDGENESGFVEASDGQALRVHMMTQGEAHIANLSTETYTEDGWRAFVTPAPGAEDYVNIPDVPTLACTRMHVSQAGSTGTTKRKIYYYYGYAAANKLQFKLSDLANIEDSEIQSVCIFMSQEIDAYDLSKKGEEIEKIVYEQGYSEQSNVRERLIFSGYESESVNSRLAYVQSHFAKARSASDICEDIEKIKSLYLVKEIQMIDIINGDYTEGEWCDVDLKGLLGDTLTTLEQLPATAFLLDEQMASKMLSYNYRLHIYDYTTKLFKGFSLDDFVYYEGEGQYAEGDMSGSGLTYKWEIEVELKDSLGQSKVLRYDAVSRDSISSKFTPFISYPSVNAKSIKINIYQYGTTSKVYSGAFALRSNESLGISYYQSEDQKPVELSEITGTPPSDIPSTAEISPTRVYRNGLKVSDVAYPSYFPAAYTYRIGNDKILGLARLTMPVSQDNFGAYQLIVFCTDGIYTMGVDKTGNGVYTDIAYFSPEVCTNRNSICEIGGAVLFASDKGLMILTSDGVDEFTPHLNGKIKFYPSNAGEVKDAAMIYDKMVSTPALTELVESISYDDADFVRFVQYADTAVSYISKKNKVIVYNKSYKHCYLIDIKTRNATKIAVPFSFDDDNSPEEKYYESIAASQYKEHSFPYYSNTGYRDCLVQSRPIKVQQDDKCSYRVVFTGYFEGQANQWADLVVFGSLDAEHWRPIGLKEKKLHGGFHNLGCITERGSWKYLMFIFAGKLSNNSHIDSIDITVNGRYNNKKR